MSEAGEPGKCAYLDFLLELLHQNLRLWTMLRVWEIELTINSVLGPCCYLLGAPIRSSCLHQRQTASTSLLCERMYFRATAWLLFTKLLVCFFLGLTAQGSLEHVQQSRHSRLHGFIRAAGGSPVVTFAAIHRGCYYAWLPPGHGHINSLSIWVCKLRGLLAGLHSLRSCKHSLDTKCAYCP